MKQLLKMVLIMICVSLAAALAGCTREEPTALESSASEMPRLADPQSAVDKIYADITVKNVESADDTLMESLGFQLEDIAAYYVRYSEGTYGLADLYIIRPIDGKEDAIREVLHEIKLARTQRFERYDVLGAYNTAKTAQIFQQGDYVVMLMLPDSELAQKILNEYIPIG